MNTLITIVNNRASQIVAFGGAVINVAVQFGVPMTDGQVNALNLALLTLVGLLAGRDINTARKQPPPA